MRVNGPFLCRNWTDLTIARHVNGKKQQLEIGEMYIKDGGYADGQEYALTPNGLNNDDQRCQGVVRARHETLNRRLKEWRVLGCKYWHDLDKHHEVFMAVAIAEFGCPFQV